MTDIRHIATSFNGDRAALAEFEKRVDIFDIHSQRIISSFETVLDFGGQRLAIDEYGKICVCGCWERHGICGYDTETGNLIWQRKDLKKVQHIQILQFNESMLFASFEIGSSRLLDLRTGVDIKKTPGTCGYFESRFEAVDVLVKAGKSQLIDRATSKVKANIAAQSFATLDISFSPESVLIAESGGPLSCYCTRDGKLEWRIGLNEDGHFLRTSYNETMNVYLGITWPFVTGGDKKLKYINKVDGTVENEVSLNCPAETEFARYGNILLTSDHEIIEIATGSRKNWVS